MLSPLTKLLKTVFRNHQFVKFILRTDYFLVPQNLQQFIWCWIDLLVESCEQNFHRRHEFLSDGFQELLNFRICNATEGIWVMEVDQWLVSPVNIVVQVDLSADVLNQNLFEVLLNLHDRFFAVCQRLIILLDALDMLFWLGRWLQFCFCPILIPRWNNADFLCTAVCFEWYYVFYDEGYRISELLILRNEVFGLDKLANEAVCWQTVPNAVVLATDLIEEVGIQLRLYYGFIALLDAHVDLLHVV